MEEGQDSKKSLKKKVILIYKDKQVSKKEETDSS